MRNQRTFELNEIIKFPIGRGGGAKDSGENDGLRFQNEFGLKTTND